MPSFGTDPRIIRLVLSQLCNGAVYLRVDSRLEYDFSEGVNITSYITDPSIQMPGNRGYDVS